MKVVVVRNKIQTLLWEIFRVEVSSWSSYFSWMFVKDFQLHSFECWMRLIWERLEQCLTIFTCLTDSLLTSFHIYDVSTSRRLDVYTRHKIFKYVFNGREWEYWNSQGHFNLPKRQLSALLILQANKGLIGFFREES